MAFMTPEYLKTDWYEIDGDHGITFVPVEVVGQVNLDEATKGMFGDYYEGGAKAISEVTKRHGWGARLSASGYMDCTDWSVFDTEQEARDYIESTYEVDPDTGDEQEEG